MKSLRAARIFWRDEAYWSIVLTSGKSYSELDTSFDLLRGKRPLDWYLDVVATGDVNRIAELWLHTPTGDVALKIDRPHSAYIFNSSYASLIGPRSLVAKIIGRVDASDGTGVAFIWDVAQKQLYKDDRANALNFSGWRPGIPNIGALNLDALGIQL